MCSTSLRKLLNIFFNLFYRELFFSPKNRYLRETVSQDYKFLVITEHACTMTVPKDHKYLVITEHARAMTVIRDQKFLVIIEHACEITVSQDYKFPLITEPNQIITKNITSNNV